ncbi:MAG TPA: hypothetical protein VIK27_13305 [Candidatus Aquilonibacter sp.]
MHSLIAAALIGVLAAATPMPAPTPTAPSLPLIYHSVSRPLCSSLQDRIKPALGMMIENDQTIAKSKPYFQDYIQRSMDGSNAGQDMAVMHLESLVTPLVKNTLAVQKLLEDPAVFPAVARSADDRRLIDIKVKMLKALAAQEAALDIINGFVTTQQLGEMQHEGFGFISAITGSGNPNQSSQGITDLIGPTPNPMHPQVFDDFALQAGLAPNQYEIDPTTIPGLALGYNPISKLKDGITWTQDIGKKEAVPLVKSILAAATSCGYQPSAPPSSPSPNP